MPKTFTVADDYKDSRFDKWFKNKVIDLPHSLIEKIIRLNKVKVNKKKTKSSYRVQVGDIVDVHLRQTRNGLIASYRRVSEISTNHVNRLRADSCPKHFRRKYFINYQRTQYRAVFALFFFF